MDYLNQDMGDFTILGFTKKPEELFCSEIYARLGVIPRFINFGESGRLFFFSSYGEVAESENEIVLKLGLARSNNYRSLSSQQILAQKWIGPGFVKKNEIHGNALIASLSKTQPSFSIYKTLISAPQLYYSISQEGIICSDRMRAIICSMEEVDLNEDALPMHFLFRTVIGSSTYFRNIFRMLSGQLMNWKEENANFTLVRDLHFEDRNTIKRITLEDQEALYELLFCVISDYANQAGIRENWIGSLLSGGVDSSLIQHILNTINAGKINRSFSFLPQADSFAYEHRYAQEAIRHFQTEHTFVNFSQNDYPELLLETIDRLAYPPLLPSEPGIYSIAKYIQNRNIPIRFLFLGGGAEPSFGYTFAKSIKKLQYFSRIPALSSLLIGVGQAIQRFHPSGRGLIERGRKVQNLRNEVSLFSPLNRYDIYIDPAKIMSCFGKTAIMAALEERRTLTDQYIQSQDIQEKAAVMDMVTDSYDIVVERNQIFLSNGQETINPFIDDEVIRMALRLVPDIRYLNGFTDKFLLKNLLYQKAGLTTAWARKGGAQFFTDFYQWMKTGALRPLVDDIEVPGFLSRKDFDKLVMEPDIFLWGILVLDLFRKRILKDHTYRIR